MQYLVQIAQGKFLVSVTDASVWRAVKAAFYLQGKLLIETPAVGQPAVAYSEADLLILGMTDPLDYGRFEEVLALVSTP